MTIHPACIYSGQPVLRFAAAAKNGEEHPHRFSFCLEHCQLFLKYGAVLQKVLLKLTYRHIGWVNV